jgi:hypothetical protein
MDWPYHINTDLSPELKAVRRQSITRYTLYAHLSSLVPVALYWLYVLTVWVFRARQTRGEYAAVPGSPHVKRGKGTVAGRAARWWRWGVFLVRGRGRGGDEGQERVLHKLIGLGWAVWLGVLSIHGTGDGESCAFLMSIELRGIGRVLDHVRWLFIRRFAGFLYRKSTLFISFVPTFLFLVNAISRLDAKTSQTTSTSPSASVQSQHHNSLYCTFS